MNGPISLRSTIVAVALAAAFTACQGDAAPTGPEASSPEAQLASKSSSEKFTYDDVVFSDGTRGELEASSKVKKEGDVFTTCSYYSDDYATYLGYFASDEFGSSDREEVKSFCLSHYGDRQH